MECSAFQEDISALADGKLSPERAREVEAHVATCAQCRAFDRDLRVLKRSISELPEPEVSIPAVPSRERAPARMGLGRNLRVLAQVGVITAVAAASFVVGLSLSSSQRTTGLSTGRPPVTIAPTAPQDGARYGAPRLGTGAVPSQPRGKGAAESSSGTQATTQSPTTVQLVSTSRSKGLRVYTFKVTSGKTITFVKIDEDGRVLSVKPSRS